MKTSRSPTSRANCISWVTTSIVMPASARSRITTRTSPTSSGSSADVTSSKSITWGSIISARAIATRCCWPPESWCGCWRAFSARPTRPSSSSARFSARARGIFRTRRTAIVRLSITLRCGKRLNCWKTIPIRVRTAETSTPLRVISVPSKRMRPESSGSSRFRQRSSVLLPLPLGPMTTSTSPTPTSRSMPFRTRLSPKLFRSSWARMSGTPARSAREGGAASARVLSSAEAISPEIQRDTETEVKVSACEDQPTVVARTFPRLAELMERELERFRREHPRSLELTERAKGSLLGGVPMHWMVRWAGGFPVFAREAHGARFVDVDGHEYVDFCLGDTGAMTGHSPEPAVRAVTEQAARGITLMLPSEDALWVGEELGRGFGLPFWQFALTAPDANRFAVRIARAVTGRPKILVFNWCYHGTVDETVATLVDGEVRPREGSVGPPVAPAETTRMVEFNDVDALERELSFGDVACVLAEPALTNIGIVLPEPGFHDALRAATRAAGTLLIIDETHTICAGPGGYTRAHGLA